MKRAYSVSDLTFSYNGADPVLSVPSLEIPAGEITAFMGHNGSGKSTFIRLLAMVAAPDTGRIELLGERVIFGNEAALRRKIGFLDQQPYLFDMSVAANVEFGLAAMGVKGGELARRRNLALEEVGLLDFCDRSARELSGGEAQRVALARILALDPEVILLDEPTAHVDRKSRERIEEIIRDRVERGATAVIATHDHAQAHRLGAASYEMRGGRLREGETENIFSGTFSTADNAVVDTGRMKVRLHESGVGGATICIRARDIILSRNPLFSSAQNSLEGKIVKLELGHGDSVRITISCGEEVVAVLTRQGWESLAAGVGETIYASFKASAVEVI